VRPGEIERIAFFAGSNILNPIRYPIAGNHLQAKFSMAALLAMIALYRRAGRREFTDECVGSPEMQAMQRRISVEIDPEIEAQGFDRIRSRVELTKSDGATIIEWADERYRGGPNLPMTIDEVAAKFHACTDGLIAPAMAQHLIDDVWRIETLPDIRGLLDAVQRPCGSATERHAVA
jgi:2-methylcitrate dehydratase PrpD